MRPAVRGWIVKRGCLAVLAAQAMLASVAGAADSPTGHHAGLHTGALHFALPGQMVAAIGVEYLPDVTNSVAGVRGELLRAPTLSLRLGLASDAEFQVSWPAFNRLRVISQQEPPLLGRRLGAVSTDFGDVTVATLVRLHPDSGAWPGCGLKFAAKLPNSNEQHGIGDNTTDVFASVLLSRKLTSRLSVYTDLGLGILPARTAAFIQNDVFTYAVMSDWRALETLHLMGEVVGRATTHGAGPGTEDRGELRAGLELGRPEGHWSLLLVHGFTGWDSRGVGVALHYSVAFTLLKPGAGVARPG